MSLQSADSISHQPFIVLACLNVLLANLPEVATLGEQLEQIFGWKTHTSVDGIIPILEWGKAICAVHPLLKKYHKRYPENNVLKKWVIDITAGVEKVFTKYETAMHVLNPQAAKSLFG